MKDYLNRLKNNDASLVELDLFNKNINENVAIAISRVCFTLSKIKRNSLEALKINTSLQELNINVNNIDNNETIAICEALKVNTTLPARLKPSSGCDIPVRNITSGEIVQDNFSGTPGLALQQLYINENNIGENGVITIKDSLQYNYSLKKFMVLMWVIY